MYWISAAEFSEYQSPVLSDLLDITCEEGLVFNTKFTCLKIFHITWDFDLDTAIFWNCNASTI